MDANNEILWIRLCLVKHFSALKNLKSLLVREMLRSHPMDNMAEIHKMLSGKATGSPKIRFQILNPKRHLENSFGAAACARLAARGDVDSQM
ncbi:hypothetical protein TNCV_228311 [Trichonephila clavipes]|nr:hypothetical protein TNCV_228311 [Trichonephila clavipes]